MLRKIISGGQTGVDRAALDTSLAHNFPCGGWCPRGRLAEDGRILPKYPLRETASGEYEARTELNVQDSNGTLILTWGEPTGGTALTIELTCAHKKPCLIFDLKKGKGGVIENILEWIEENHIEILNVAGPRESKVPGIYETAKSLLEELLRRIESKI
ncbi:MAG TPA: molybdenum cofactor carrier [Candidatus Omnitrophica bacterium]|nr:molybdenum cofactor carrier [Candidatus Omnitrophota bacterium]